MINQSNSTPRSTNPPSHLRLDNLIINSPASPNQNYNGYGSNQNSPASHNQYYDKQPPAQQRLDSLLGQNSPTGPPQPPERGSSFAVMSQTAQIGTLRSPAGGNLSVMTPNNNQPSSQAVNTTPTVGVAKRVSFQDTTPPSPPSNLAPNLENIREDPNVSTW